MRTRASTAFSLIELLVVLSIVSLLVAMLLPALSEARDAAHRIGCASNLHQSGLALQMYTDDYDGWYPCIRDHRGATNQEITRTGHTWKTLNAYGWSLPSLTCPTSSFNARFRSTGSPLVMPYFYLAGRGDRTDSGNWFGYNDNQGYPTRAHNMRPVMRVNGTDLPHDTALMTDLFRSDNPLHTNGTYVRYLDLPSGTHANVPANHTDENDPLIRSEGLNFLTVDQSVRWKLRSDTTLRYSFQYHRVYW